MPDWIDELVGRASPARLSRLFAMLNSRPAAAASGDTEAMFRRMSDPAGVAAMLAAVSPNGADDLVAQALDPTATLAQLRSTFEQARDLVARASDAESRAAAELLRHAAAAAALARHGVVLGDGSMVERGAVYAGLARQLAAGPFGGLFADAAIAAGQPLVSSNPSPGA
jgi:hypothetical protein